MMKIYKPILLLIIFLSSGIFATNYYVDGNNGNDTNDGKTWATAKKSIEATRDIILAGDNVFVKAGTYNYTASNLATQDCALFTLTNVNYYGGFAGTESSPTQRALSDKDKNGIVEPWEFTNETILSITLNNTTNLNSTGLCVTSNTIGFCFFDGFTVAGAYNYNVTSTNTTAKPAIAVCNYVYFRNNTIRNWTLSGTVNAGDIVGKTAAYTDGSLLKIYPGGGIVENCLIEKNTSTLTAGTSQSFDGLQSPFIRISSSNANASNAFRKCIIRNNRVKVDFSKSPLTSNVGVKSFLVEIVPSSTPYQTVFKDNVIHNNDGEFICKSGMNFTASEGAILKVDSKSDSVINVTPSYVTRGYYGAKLEPVSGVLHGVGQGDNNTTFLQYSKNVSPTKPVLYMCYIGLDSPVASLINRGKFLKTQIDPLAPDVMLQLGLSFDNKNAAGKQNDSLVSVGYYDENIDTVVSIMKKLNRPILIRIGFEFEGSWNAYKATYYKQAFMRITDKIRAKNVNAATVWCSAGGSASFMSMTQLLNYYPGDSYVDWWGVDVFSASEITDTRLATFLNNSKAHLKPVLIGESTPRLVGVLNSEISWNTWFQPYFNMIYQFPQIKAFCYINWNWANWAALYNQSSWANWGDGRIEQNGYVLNHYRNELKTGLFIHSAY